MNNFTEIISKFEKHCKTMQKKYSVKSLNFIFNEDLKALNKNEIKYILVGDNPGNTEAKEKRYLTGPAGLSARIFFERFFVSDFKKEVLVLNKTPVYTSITKRLKETDHCILKETQEFTVSMISDLYKLLKVPVIISGFAGCHKSNDGFLDISSKNKNAVGKYFFSSLKNSKFGKANKDLYITKHFSRLSIFEDFTIKMYDKYMNDNNFNILKAIGEKYKYELYNLKK